MKKKSSKYTIVGELYIKREFVGFEFVQRIEQSFKSTLFDVADTFNLVDQTDVIITVASDKHLELLLKFGKAKTKVNMCFSLDVRDLNCLDSVDATWLHREDLQNIWFEFRLYEDMSHTYIDRRFFNPNIIK